MGIERELVPTTWTAEAKAREDRTVMLVHRVDELAERLATAKIKERDAERRRFMAAETMRAKVAEADRLEAERKRETKRRDARAQRATVYKRMREHSRRRALGATVAIAGWNWNGCGVSGGPMIYGYV